MIKKLLFAGLFLVILGIGNIIVGSVKGNQYAVVAEELAAISRTSKRNPSTSSSHSYPLIQIENSRHTAEHLIQREQKALMRRDLYRVVVFGGQAMLAVGILLFVASGLLARMFRQTS
jgi:hypothetical protein